MGKIKQYNSYAKSVGGKTVYMVPVVKILHKRADYVQWKLGITDTEHEQIFSNYDDAIWAFKKIDKKTIDEINNKDMLVLEGRSNDPLFMLWLSSTVRKKKEET